MFCVMAETLVQFRRVRSFVIYCIHTKYLRVHTVSVLTAVPPAAEDVRSKI